VQKLLLAELLAKVGPIELDRLLDSFASGGDDQLGLKVVESLEKAAARSSLRAETLKPRLAKYGPAVAKRAESLYAALEADTLKQRARLEELLAGLKDGDIRRGQLVFNGTKGACSSCHAIGYLGGNIGPDLTRIGGIRSERDLLESIVFPSASFVRSYEPTQVTMKSGKVYNGLVKQETPTEILLVITANEQYRLRREDIEDIEPGKVSIMPAGLDQQLTLRELADLIAFLKACK
jgi:putative heme-binding domain-containing protein